MNTIKSTFLKSLAIALLFFSSAKGQSVEPNWLQKQWKAEWIKVPESSNSGYGVYLFRKNIELQSTPKNFLVHVSGDNRYKLYVNEKLVSLGPARGDLLHWNFETVDLAPYLNIGKNTIAALVWNEGKFRAEAHISSQTGFILQGGSEEAQIANTNNSWLCIEDKGFSPVEVKIPEYYVAGPGDHLDRNKSIAGWQKVQFDDKNWTNAKVIGAGYPKYKKGYGGPNAWMLVPSQLPQMELKEQRIPVLRKAEGITVASTFPLSKTQITIPANTQVTLLVDQTFLTNAYPVLIFSGGANALISMEFAESLYVSGKNKGNRNEVDSKSFRGRKDVVISDGSNNQQFTTLSWRTFRYIELKIETKETPLVLEDLYGVFTAYPFELKAKLDTDVTELNEMFEIGWRTARLCAVETYMDTPYYEQLQYIGDTRIQGLVSLYNSGDDRLLKNAINLIDYSRQPEGITLSRYPTTNPQYITPFSLLYIGMLHDYMMYGKDVGFVKSKLHGAREILQYFSQFQQEDGSVVNLPWWNFTDWVNVNNWGHGVREPGKDGKSALIDFQLLSAYQIAADMEGKIGNKEYQNFYKQKADQLKTTISKNYWDKTKGLFADRPEKDIFSQHTNALAILTGTILGKEAIAAAQKMLNDKTLAPASIYYKYYVHLALTQAGFGNDYLNWLDKWRENIKMGLTTWAETSELDTSRSDCHAWGSSPNIEFFRTVLGIDSEGAGFSKVKIEPHLGVLKNISGEMPHPKGTITVKYAQTDGYLTAEIELPKEISGRFIWKGKSHILKSGKNAFKIY
nr:alpha-L-rhamnosidase C-terminal domain-containing protein [uncultured Flavobacterium sp.]